MNIMTKTRLWLNAFGFDPHKFVYALKSLPWFFKSYRNYLAEGDDGRVKEFYPCLSDRFESSGNASGHYFHQDLWVAQKINEKKPAAHIDIGSRVDGFVAHVASFRKVVVGDIRPLVSSVENIEFIQLDLVKGIPLAFKNAFDSVSCLHTIEHIGLGRYGDVVSQTDYKIFWRNLCDLARPGGEIYISTPVGVPVLQFNAHRVSKFDDFFELVAADVEIKEVALVDDLGSFSVYVPKEVPTNVVDTWSYGLAIFRGVKRK